MSSTRKERPGDPGDAQTEGSEAAGAIPTPALAASSRDAHARQMESLFQRYHGGLVKSLVARTRSWEEARDIASQAFTEMLAHEQPSSIRSFAAYLYRTARNLTTNHLLHRVVQRRRDPVVGYEPTAAESSPEGGVRRLQRQRVLKEAIDTLPAHLRMALVLRIWDELPHDVIVARFAAAGVRIDKRTVRRYLDRAFEHLRQALIQAERSDTGAND